MSLVDLAQWITILVGLIGLSSIMLKVAYTTGAHNTEHRIMWNAFWQRQMAHNKQEGNIEHESPWKITSKQKTAIAGLRDPNVKIKWIGCINGLSSLPCEGDLARMLYAVLGPDKVKVRSRELGVIEADYVSLAIAEAHEAWAVTH